MWRQVALPVILVALSWLVVSGSTNFYLQWLDNSYQQVFDDLLFGVFQKLDHRILAAGVIAYRRAREAALKPYPHVTACLMQLIRRGIKLAVLTARGPTVKFLVGMAERLTQPERRDRTALLIRLFRAADQPRGARGFTGYEPLRLPVPTRHAAYRANLLVLVLLVAGARRASELFGPGEPEVRHAWHSLALLWHAQLRDEEWTSLVDAVEVERTWTARGDCDTMSALFERD